MGHLVAGLGSFRLSGRIPPSLIDQLSAELARTGRPCHHGVSALPAISSDDAWSVACSAACCGWEWIISTPVRVSDPQDGRYEVTDVSEADDKSFDLAMSCGCQSCLLCLRRSGVLPRDFQVLPKFGSPFGTRPDLRGR